MRQKSAVQPRKCSKWREVPEAWGLHFKYIAREFLVPILAQHQLPRMFWHSFSCVVRQIKGSELRLLRVSN